MYFSEYGARRNFSPKQNQRNIAILAIYLMERHTTLILTRRVLFFFILACLVFFGSLYIDLSCIFRVYNSSNP